VSVKDRPASERKRLDQTAIERMNQDAGRWDWVLAVDKSKQATNLVELLEADYGEVVEIENKDDKLKKQKGQGEELIERTKRERGVVLKGAPLLDQAVARLEADREEAAVLTRARLKPEAAEELFRAFQVKTGRVLTKPLPLGEKDRAAKFEELGQELFERYVDLDASTPWGEILAGRLATAGVTAGAGAPPGGAPGGDSAGRGRGPPGRRA